MVQASQLFPRNVASKSRCGQSVNLGTFYQIKFKVAANNKSEYKSENNVANFNRGFVNEKKREFLLILI